jgi:hypothetical protein
MKGCLVLAASILLPSLKFAVGQVSWAAPLKIRALIAARKPRRNKGQSGR